MGRLYITQGREPMVWVRGRAMETGRTQIGLGEGGDIRVRERCVSSCLLGFCPGYLGVRPTAQELRKNRGEILGLPFWS